MTSEDHLILSAFIKKIHKDLRTNAESQGVDRAWSEHCKNEKALKEYAKCMKQLATEHWDKKHKGDIKNSRNAWVVHQITNYFSNEIYLSRRQKELREKEKTSLSCAVKSSQFQAPYLLLDVGSCYNPFKNVENIEAIGIDICPANKDVYKCDFINLVVERTTSQDTVLKNETSVQEGLLDTDVSQEVKIIQSLCQESFDIVLFSLLLEYIPCSKLRFLCCAKAYHLLKFEGILIIVTPDSKHETSSNVQIMKQWKHTMESIGFKRIKYEKLKHIHCMVFRKSSLVPPPEVLFREGELLIPQDINKEKCN